MSHEKAALSVHSILFPETRVMIFELALLIPMIGLRGFLFAGFLERFHVDWMPIHFTLPIFFVVEEVTRVYKFVLRIQSLVLMVTFEQALSTVLPILEFAEICDLKHFAINFLHFLEVSHSFSFAVTKIALIDITICVYVNGVAMVEILLEPAIILLAILFFVLPDPFLN